MKGYKMNQNESMNGDSALGDISVLSPSQRREQERRRKEQEIIFGIPVGIFCLWFIWALVNSIKESRIKKVQSR